MAKVTVSRYVGKTIDTYRASAEGFCAECETNLKAWEAGILASEKLNYFDLALSAFFGETETSKSKEEENEKYILRAIAEGTKKVASLTENMKKSTPLYGYMSDKEKLFSLLCSECVGYYYEGAFIFAKVATVAKKSTNLSAEEIAKLNALCEEETENGFKCYKFEESDKEGNTYFMYVTASNLEAWEAWEAGNLEMRNQRIKVHTTCEEAPKMWRSSKGNIETLKASNKFGYLQVLPVISKFVSNQFEQARKEEKKAAKKAKKEAATAKKVAEKLEKLTANIVDKTAKLATVKGLSEAGFKSLSNLEEEAKKEAATATAAKIAEAETAKLIEALEAFKVALQKVTSKEEAPKVETVKAPKAAKKKAA